jgi:hypothetical protein
MTKSFTAATVLSLRTRAAAPDADYVPELARLRPAICRGSHPPPAHDDCGLPHRRSVGDRQQGLDSTSSVSWRAACCLGARHAVRVLEHRLRHPRPGHHERCRANIARGSSRILGPSHGSHGVPEAESQRPQGAGHPGVRQPSPSRWTATAPSPMGRIHHGRGSASGSVPRRDATP